MPFNYKPYSFLNTNFLPVMSPLQIQAQNKSCFIWHGKGRDEGEKEGEGVGVIDWNIFIIVRTR